MADTLWFDAVFGRNLAAEIADFAPPPFLVVTMHDLRPLLDRHLGDAGDAMRIVHVDSMEEENLLAALGRHPDFCSVVGFGGGRALDAAKYFSWRAGKPLFQLPTALSVDAAFGHRSAVRRARQVRYVGWAVPECVYLDYDIIRAAPPLLNHSGIGDILCFYTAVLDWRLADMNGLCEPQWPYDEAPANRSLEHAENVLRNRTAFRDLTDAGIRLMADAHRWGGGCYHAAGWNPRPVEGVEHLFFYALESLSGKTFVHGQPVCLGVVAGALMHGDSRTGELLDAIREIGVDIRPRAMGVTWGEVRHALLGLRKFARDNKLPHGIAHEKRLDDGFVDELRALVEQKHR